MPEGREKINRLRRAMYSRKNAERIGARARHALHEETNTLATDWERGNSGGVSASQVAPASLRVTRKLLWGMFAIAATFFFVTTGVVGWYLLGGSFGGFFSSGNIDIQIQGPTQVSAGEPTELQIFVTNNEGRDLELADLILTYPDGTRSPNDFKTDLKEQRITLGTIPAGARQQGTVFAVLIGQEGKEGVIHVELEYRLKGSSAIFVAERDYAFAFATTPLSLTVTANDSAISGQELDITATVTSNVDAVVRDALLLVELPFGFTMTAADPEVGEDNLWELGDIAPGDARQVHIRGVLKGAPRDDRVFRITLGTRRSQSDSQIAVVLREVLQHVAIAQPFLGLTLAVGDDSGADVSVANPGKSVTVNVSWKNELTVPISDMVLVAQLSGISFPGSTVRTNDGFYRSSDNSVIWNKNTTNNVFAQVDPGESGKVSFSFQLPSSAQLTAVKNPQITIVLNAAGRRSAESGVPEALQATTERTIKIASNPQLITQALYHTNPLGSTGPLPPRINQETTYAVVWTLRNTTNDLKEAKMVGVFPPNVRWTGLRSPANEHITFNAGDGTVTWNIGDVVANAGSGSVPPRQVAFSIAISPSSSQLGQSPPLVQGQKFTAVDVFTGATITRTATDITTRLEGDAGFVTSEAEVVQ